MPARRRIAAASPRPLVHVAVLAVFLCASCPIRAVFAASPSDSILQGLNEKRGENHLPQLARQPALDAAAAIRAAEIAALPPGRGLVSRRDIRDFLRQSGVRRVRRATEYLQRLRGYADPARASVDEMWHDADGRSLLLDPDWEGVGIAAQQKDDGTIVTAFLFYAAIDSAIDVRALEQRTEEAVNEARRRNGLPALEHADALAGVARAHSQDMAQRRYFGHETPEGSGPADRVDARGIEYRKVAENVAKNQGWDDPVAKAVQGWLDSRGHRHNIMDREVRQTGVGVAVDFEEGQYYFTQLFLQPPRKARRRH